MKTSLLIVFTLALIGTAVHAQLPSHLSPDDAKPSPTGVVDLSLPPRHRWRRVVQEAVARHGFEHTFLPLLTIIDEGLWPHPTLAAWFEATLQTRFPIFYEELRGIVDTLNDLGYNETAGVTMKSFSAFNWLSEINNINLTATTKAARDLFYPEMADNGEALRNLACTSLISHTKTGTVLHARNDDASAHHYTTNLTVDVTFLQGGSVRAKATAFLPFIGTYTVMVPGVASLTEDQRGRFFGGGKWSPAEYMALVDSLPGVGPSHMLMRQGMIDDGGANFTTTSSSSGAEEKNPLVPPPTERTFDSILKYLQTANFGQPAYLILGGTNNAPTNDHGAIIARNLTVSWEERHNHSHTLRLGQSTKWVPFHWALIQTNWDFWKALPYPQFDPRREVLVAHYEKYGQDRIATVEGMLGALSLQSNKSSQMNGVLNVATIFSVIMIPSNSTLRSYLRNGHRCCA